jgi:hypothetical protein
MPRSARFVGDAFDQQSRNAGPPAACRGYPVCPTENQGGTGSSNPASSSGESTANPRDPNYGSALAWAAAFHFNSHLSGWSEET